MSGIPHHRLAQEFLALSRFLHEGGSPGAARLRVVHLARTMIEGCDWACITMRPTNASAWTAGATDDVAREIDRLQYDVEDGPCLEAARTRQPMWSEDLAEETRWPQFCALAREDGRVRSVLAFHLLDEPVPTALNLYSASPHGLGDEAIATGAVFAIHAATLMAHADSEQRAQTLGNALSTSRQIGAAIGILMRAHGITQDEAFRLLRSASNQMNRKLHEIAEDVTALGDIPDRSRS
ncbi:GAF and ANTAR domain-containing protein [Brachybacterium hainanense]|uniref:GAF and ANTAR domain-containing protein n=1 Tax=Brachybacterium hainanense TaxID=1541174 RepID=A0ABV6RCP9_9MICO